MKDITSKLKDNENWYNYNKFVSTRKWNKGRASICLCDISPSGYKPFYFGINIIDKILNNSEFNCGRAVYETNEQSQEWYTKKAISSFDAIGVGVYMCFQLFALPKFLLSNKIQPLNKHRTDTDPLIIIGGQTFHMIHAYDKFVDIACVGEGEEWILEIMAIIEKYKRNRKKILEGAATIEGAYVPLIHGYSDNEFTIKKRIIKEENLHNSLLDESCIASKTQRKVIEIARGCKYNCAFCALAKRMYPFRQNDKEKIKDCIRTFNEGAQIYPFAPDESSYKHNEEIANYAKFCGMRYYTYNHRLNSITSKSIRNKDLSERIVFGIDGISQKVIDITNKGIRLERMINEVAPEVYENNYRTLKLNYVFNYYFEKDEDYKELEWFWNELLEIRRKSGQKDKERTMIHIAPTPFVPDWFIPLQYIKIRKEIDKRFVETYQKVRSRWRDGHDNTSYMKMEGLQNYENWKMNLILVRYEKAADFIYFCFKNGFTRSNFEPKLTKLWNEYCKINKIEENKLFDEIPRNKSYVWDKIDWSGGLLKNFKELPRKQVERIIENAGK